MEGSGCGAPTAHQPGFHRPLIGDMAQQSTPTELARRRKPVEGLTGPDPLMSQLHSTDFITSFHTETNEVI